MLRSLLLVPTLAIAGLLGSAPVAGSSTQDPQAHSAEIEFAFHAGHGLHASVENSSEGITLEIAGRHRFVTYRAQGESTEAGLKVQFGDLGLIHFTGEREYAMIEETEVEGRLAVWRESEWRCPGKRPAFFRRSARAAAGISSTRSRARKEPAAPFSGSAIFKRRPHSRDLWRSTIEVPLLGTDPLDVRAPAFRARLARARPDGR